MDDSTTLEPTYEESFGLLREVHDPTHLDISNDEIFGLYDHLGESLHSPTSYTSIFCSIHPNEVWVKGFFFIVPHEDYGIPISPFDDDMIKEQYYLHLKKNPLLHYDDIHLHGCIYGIHLETHEFLFSLPSPFDVRGSSSHT